MSSFLTCNEPEISTCKEDFRLSASGWIDENNFGSPRVPIATRPPNGLRLRWNFPFLNPEFDKSRDYPLNFIVWRTGDLTATKQFFRPKVTTGHKPRTLAPNKLWRNMNKRSDIRFHVGTDSCDSADAIYIQLATTSPPVQAELLNTRGARSVVISLSPGDQFYWEVADFNAIVFSEPPILLEDPMCLDLKVDMKQSLDVQISKIAVIDARKWIQTSLANIGQRLSTKEGKPFVTIGADEWDEVRRRGASVVQASDAGNRPSEADLNFLLLAASTRWEVATLIGWGFLDGEHPPGKGLDQIDEKAMITQSPGIYGYQVEAQIKSVGGLDSSLLSSAFFAVPEPMAGLSAPEVRLLAPGPICEVQRRNKVDKEVFLNSPNISKENDREAIFCSVGYELSTDNLCNEVMFTSPRALDSQLTGDKFKELGEFRTSLDGPIPFAPSFKLTTRRNFDFEIPFIDSKVWLEVGVGDHWDRYLKCRPTNQELPQLRYSGSAPPLDKAVCKGKEQTVTLDLLGNETWKADRIARVLHDKSHIEVLAKAFGVEKKELKVRIGRPALMESHSWGAIVESDISQLDQSILTGGVLQVGRFTARVIRFLPDFGGKVICSFEANPICAGEDLYTVDAGHADAILSESNDSVRLWKSVSKINIFHDGMPESRSKTIPINSILDPIITSHTFHFATRLVVSHDKRTYTGPISAPVVAPYLHAPPQERPELCLKISQLGVDFYGRSMLRAAAENCKEFDTRFLSAVVGAHLPDLSKFPEKDKERLLRDRGSKGLFGPQQAFRGKVLFEGFTELEGTPDGEAFTIGVSNYRESDNAAGPPLIVTFIARNIGD